MQTPNRQRFLAAAYGLALVLLLGPARADLIMRPYLQAVSTTGIWVLVECDTTNAATVEYGLAPAFGRTATTAFFLTTSATTYVHRVPLTGLQPGTRYHYRAAQGGAPSADAAFHTAVSTGTAFRFAFTADFQSPASNQDAIVAQLRTVHPPHFLLYGGDLAASGYLYANWKDHFFSKQRDLIAGTPFFACVGNHDKWITNTQAFLQAPASASGDQAFYAFDYGDAHILVLNNMVDYSLTSDQARFARADLAAARRRWTIAAFHMPAYSAGGHGENKGMIAMTRDLFEPAGVDLVLAGHNHFYQHNLVNGIHHIVLGPGGARCRAPGTAAYTLASVASPNVGIVDVTPDTLALTVFRDDGAVLDTVTLHQDAAGKAARAAAAKAAK